MSGVGFVTAPKAITPPHSQITTTKIQIRTLPKRGSADHRPAAHSLRATGRFCGPRLFGPAMERSNSCARIGGHSHPVHDQTAALLLFVGAHARHP